MSILAWVAACIGIMLMIYAFYDLRGAGRVLRFLFVKPVKAIIYSTIQKSKEDISAKLASIELDADQDVAKGNKTSIIPLFSNTDLRQDFQLLENVEDDKTGIKVTIAKVGSFQTKADTTRKKGEETNFGVLLTRNDFTKKIAATDDIKKGDKLMVTLERL